LSEFGLPLVPSNAPQFPSLVRHIENLPGPGPAVPPVVLNPAAVMLNQSDYYPSDVVTCSETCSPFAVVPSEGVADRALVTVFSSIYEPAIAS
jgi:hypothetical protein